MPIERPILEPLELHQNEDETANSPSSSSVRRHSFSSEDSLENSFNQREMDEINLITPHLSPMNVEWEAPQASRHSGTTVKRAIGEAKSNKQALASTASGVAAQVAHHIPGLGIFSSGFAIKTVDDQIQQTRLQIQDYSDTREQINNLHSDPAKTFQEALDFAVKQADERLSKLEVKAGGAKLSAAGATLTAISPLSLGATAIPGIAISAAGSAVNAGVNVKSGVTFFKKLVAGTLGRERYRHARALYGLALEHLELEQSIPPPARHSDSNHALEQIRTEGTEEERLELRKKCFTLLQDIGITGTTPEEIEEFQLEGLERIAYNLRSSW